MKSEPKTIIFISRSGGGKGTQVALLKEYFDKNSLGEIVHIETGSAFREFFFEGSYTSQLAKEITNSGKLQPSFLAVWSWASQFIQKMKPEAHLFLDGTPRESDEQDMLLEALEFFGINKFTVINLHISREVALNRLLLRKRADDTEESINNRLNWFDSDVVPVIEKFKANPNCNYLEIDGEKSIEEIHKDILDKLSL